MATIVAIRAVVALCIFGADASVIAAFKVVDMPDPEALMPEGWDADEDGEWEAPVIETPALTSFKKITSDVSGYRYAWTSSPEVLAKLGEPYVTTRPGAEGSRTGHIGMGLGFFIAKTLLERTGATVDFRNGRRGGAVVSARWPRPALEAPGYTGA